MSHILLKNQNGTPPHSGLTGLLLNDHPQYRLTASTSPITATTAYTDVIQFNTGYTEIGHQTGRVHWSDEDHTLEIDLGNNVHLQVGQEQFIYVENHTGVDFVNGQVVYINGAHGNRPTINLANAATKVTSEVIGVLTQDIAGNNSMGYVTTNGLVHDLDTHGLGEGTPLYLATGATSGTTTIVKPQAPYFGVQIGYVVKDHPTSGIIFVHPSHAMSISDLNDVDGVIPDSTNKYLVWNDTKKYWDANKIYHSGLTESLGGAYHLSESDYNYVTGSTYVTRDPSGFPNYKADSTLGFTSSTRYFEIKPITTTFDVMLSGKVYKYPTTGLTIPDTQGLQFVYFSANTGALTSTTTFTSDLITKHALCSYIYWATGNTSIPHTGATGVGDERHGVKMPAEVHLYFHSTFGARFESGFSLQGLNADVVTPNDQSAVVGVAAGIYHDEDLIHSILTTDTGSTIPVLYQSGATGQWFRQPPRIHPIITAGTPTFVPQYNLGTTSWGLSPVTANQFFLTHFFATNDITNPIVAIVGQTQYTSIANARTGAANEILSLITNGLPGPEFLPIGTVIYEYRTSYNNQSHCRVRTDTNGASWVDFRYARINTVSNINDHGNLSGLGDDDHPQYLNTDRAEAWLTGTSHVALSATTYSGITYNKAISIVDPRANEKIPLFYTINPINFTNTLTVVSGASASVTWNLLYGSDFSAAGTLINSGITTNTTTGVLNTISSAVTANNFIWLTTTATGGTPTLFHITAYYREN